MIADKPLTHDAPQPAAAHIRTIESADIFRGATEVLIRHDGAIYRMKITRQGKLILNK
jgi:hemin uptake protein HemP